ncbi:hypothetical protein B0H16DRAFT_257799 [Mycena metata]|uniref:Uncharacterized protein n=1 Tax=Mycena metata TaxID=1033252 RepID=A0AAD7HSI0_9AGAR|nr:hypothetical protein B0H16DRAFT_257799 [Mycena metata]
MVVRQEESLFGCQHPSSLQQFTPTSHILYWRCALITSARLCVSTEVFPTLFVASLTLGFFRSSQVQLQSSAVFSISRVHCVGSSMLVTIPILLGIMALPFLSLIRARDPRSSR